MRLQLTDGVLDLDGACVDRRSAVELTPLEVRLLRHLSRMAPRPVSNDVLLEAVWGYAPGARSRTVRVTVMRLRQKLEVDPSRPVHLVTVRGEGYRLDAVPVRDTDLHPDLVPGPMVGRRAMASGLRARLTPGSWVTLVGGPGMGKTRLALELAERWPGPVGWFACEPYRTADAALGAIAGRLGCRVVKLGERLAERVALVVLDGVEGIAVDLAPRIEDWNRIEGLTVLVTSRLALGLGAEQPLEVGPLDLDASIELIATRAGLEPAEAAPLAVACDGVPLACELTAAAARGALPDPEAGSGLDAALERSWTLLGPRLRETLVGCTAFEGAFDVEVAKRVVGDEAPSQLHQLRLHGLLTREGRRLRMLRSVRDPVEQRTPVVVARARQRHAHLFAERAAAAERALYTPARPEAIQGLIDDRPEHEAAMAWGLAHDPELAGRILLPLTYALRLRTGERMDRWEDEVLAVHPGGTPTAVRIRISAAGRTGVPDAFAALTEAAAPFPDVAALLAMQHGRACVLYGEMDRAAAIIDQALERPAPPRFRARLLLGRGKVARARGLRGVDDYRAAREALGEVVDPPLTNEILLSLGRDALDRGAVGEARGFFSEALARGEAEGDYLRLLPVSALANADLAAGDLAAAIQGFQKQEHLAEKLGDRRSADIARIRTALARMERADAEADEAIAWADRCLRPTDSVELHAAVGQARVLRALDVERDVDAAFARIDALELPPARALERSYLHVVRAWLEGRPVDLDVLDALNGAGLGGYARGLEALRALDGDPAGERALRQYQAETSAMMAAFLTWVVARRAGEAVPASVRDAAATAVLLRLALRREDQSRSSPIA